VSDSITDTLGRRLYLLDAGRQGASQLLSGLQIFAIKLDEQVDAPTLVRVQEALREDSTTLERWWRG
jgi:hypothetical protein